MNIRAGFTCFVRVLFVFVVASGTVPATSLWSAEWFIEPSLTIRGEANSNLTLTSFDHSPTFGHWVSPGARFGGATEAFVMSGRLAADFVQYYGGQNTNLTNIYFPVDMKYSTEKDVFGLSGGFTRDNTLMGELRQTGVVLNFTQRNVATINPSWTHYLTEKLWATSSYQYNDTQYENGARLGLADYTLHIGSAGMSYQFTERDQIQLNATVVRFNTASIGLTSTIVGPQVVYSRSLSDTLSVAVSGGPQHVTSTIDTRFGSFSDGTLVWVFAGNVEKKWETWKAKVETGREINPSGFGLLLRTDKVSLTISHQMTDRLTLSATGSYLIADSVKTTATSNTNFPENRLIYLTPKINWRLSEYWTADVTYTYAQRDVPIQTLTALANSGTIMFTYTPVKFTFGR